MYNYYDDYIRSILGYNNMQNQTTTNIAATNSLSVPDEEIEGCYPEIYKVVYPMIRSRCQRNTKPVTKELIEEMTGEIYQAIEGEVFMTEENIEQNRGENKNKIIADEKQINRKESDVQNRELRNSGLQDLIKILLIRELLRRPHRPPMPGPRPPFPGGINPGPRPPIMPRNYGYNSFYNDIYESF